jgi:hypothetical protein
MMITLFKKDRREKLHYYTIHDRQLTLVSRYALTISSSVEKGGGREKILYFETRREMDRKIRQLFATKIKSGYALLYKFERKDPVDSLFSETGRIEKAQALLSAVFCG